MSEWNQDEHDKCPKTFPSGDCQCSCGHAGERTLESRKMVFRPFVAPKAVKIESD